MSHIELTPSDPLGYILDPRDLLYDAYDNLMTNYKLPPLLYALVNEFAAPNDRWMLEHVVVTEDDGWGTQLVWAYGWPITVAANVAGSSLVLWSKSYPRKLSYDLSPAAVASIIRERVILWSEL